MQDFPWKHGGSDKGSGFESDLIDYLSALKWPEFFVQFPERGNFSLNSSFFKKFDYSKVTVRLIAFVPGYHSGLNIKKWGHMKIRSVLQDCVFDKEMGTHEDPFSSTGSNIYQADVETDEVYAQMTLQPLTPQEQKDTFLPVELGTLSR
ncbi:tyrosyl-DNA phosphodiesterase 1-like [Helianthus annuus]|uniref:tyrosyl-DNA phosphodiesterase 1-like n=1 Tax=Helianthus annuus TaxID=4232 RepID=UPI0016530EB6|nr:tyrosyl-DNA phosphodiesterase 1-like [Helianthus annuus]XP_035836965.1 tyrosyl-DNA phosphodiesterase 1-like [Helianthus annuus]